MYDRRGVQKNLFGRIDFSGMLLRITLAMIAPPPAGSSATSAANDFIRELKQAATQVRASLSSLMTSSGMSPQDPQVLMRKWGVNKTLSWKISKVVQTDDAFLALQQVPGREGIDVLLKKGAAAGANPQNIEATRAAIDRFEKLIEVHCGDRVTFEIMGSDITPVGRQQRDEQHRRQLFEGASYLWGVQARMYLNLRFLAPGAVPGTVDIASVSGLLDFRRLRENVRWPLFKRQTTTGTNAAPLVATVEPLDPASAGGPVPLMLEFCSHPSALLNAINEAGSTSVELAPGPVGNFGVTSYMVGAVERGLPNARNPQDPNTQTNQLWTMLNTPAELLIYDLYMHESFRESMPPVPILTRASGSSPPLRAEMDQYQLPLSEPLLDLGQALSAPFTPEVENYADIFQAVFDRTGWSSQAFHGFRMKIAYPPIVSALAMRYTMPLAPDAARG
jgi:hypothetical protein